MANTYNPYDNVLKTVKDAADILKVILKRSSILNEN